MIGVNSFFDLKLEEEVANAGGISSRNEKDLDAIKKNSTDSHKDYIKSLLFMWDEVYRCYHVCDVNIPLLGEGATKFELDEDKNPINLVKTLLFTLKLSNIRLTGRKLLCVLPNRQCER